MKAKRERGRYETDCPAIENEHTVGTDLHFAELAIPASSAGFPVRLDEPATVRLGTDHDERTVPIIPSYLDPVFDAKHGHRAAHL